MKIKKLIIEHNQITERLAKVDSKLGREMFSELIARDEARLEEIKAKMGFVRSALELSVN